MSCLKSLVSAPQDALYTRLLIQKTSEVKRTAIESYFAPKMSAFAAIILSTFNAPLYLLKGCGQFASRVSELQFRKAFAELGANVGKAIKSIVLVALLITLLAVSILIPCAFRLLSQTNKVAPEIKKTRKELLTEIETLQQSLSQLTSDMGKLAVQKLDSMKKDSDVGDSVADIQNGIRGGSFSAKLQVGDPKALQALKAYLIIISKIENENASLKIKLDQAASEANKKIQDLQGQIERLQKELENAAESELSDIAEDEVSEEGDAIEGAEGNAVAAESEKVAKEREEDPVKVILQVNVNASQSGEVNEQLEQIKKELTALKVENTQLQTLKDEAVGQSQDLIQEKSLMATRLKRLTEDLDKARAELKRLKPFEGKLAVTQAELASAKEEIQKLKALLESARTFPTPAQQEEDSEQPEKT